MPGLIRRVSCKVGTRNQPRDPKWCLILLRTRRKSRLSKEERGLRQPREEPEASAKGRGGAAEPRRSPAEPKLNSRLATGAARRSNGREEPIRMSGANHFRAGGGVAGEGMLTSPSSAHQDLRSGGGLGTVRCPLLNSGAENSSEEVPLRVLTRAWIP